jgi:hypothetical protein
LIKKLGLLFLFTLIEDMASNHADYGMLRRLKKQGVFQEVLDANGATAYPSLLHDPQDWL